MSSTARLCCVWSIAERGAFDPALDPRSGWFSTLKHRVWPGYRELRSAAPVEDMGSDHKEIITELQSFSIRLFNALRGAEPKDAGVYGSWRILGLLYEEKWGRLSLHWMLCELYLFFSLSPAASRVVIPVLTHHLYCAKYWTFIYIFYI